MSESEKFFIMLNRLDQVRKSMAGAKNTKLLHRWTKRGDYAGASASDLIDHIFEEWDEFVEAVDSGTGIYYSQARSLIRDEVVDLVNCLEMLWDLLNLGDA